jgi:hypothetical protein
VIPELSQRVTSSRAEKSSFAAYQRQAQEKLGRTLLSDPLAVIEAWP